MTNSVQQMCAWLQGCLKLSITQVPIMLAAVSSIATLQHPGLAVEGIAATDMHQAMFDYGRAADFLAAADVPLTDAEAQLQRQMIAPLGFTGIGAAVALFLLLRSNWLRAVDAGSHALMSMLGMTMSPAASHQLQVSHS